MQNIYTTAELKMAIQLLEVDYAIKEELLKEHFHRVYESLKPINLIKGTFKEIISSPNLIDNVLGTLVGMGTGYLSKKIFIGTSGNIIRKLFGSALQVGVTNVVSQHPEVIKSLSQMIFQRIFRKKEHNE